jgi:hypothetical protein
MTALRWHRLGFFPYVLAFQVFPVWRLGVLHQGRQWVGRFLFALSYVCYKAGFICSLLVRLLVEVSDLKGVKRSSAGEDEVWLYLYGRDEAGFSDWQRAFVDSGLMAKQTWLNHKKSLEAQGKVRKKISKISNGSVYYVPPEKKAMLNKLATKKELNASIEKLKEFATDDELKEILTVFSSIPTPLINSKFTFFDVANVSKIMMKVRARRIKNLIDPQTPIILKGIVDKILKDKEKLLPPENLMFYYYPLDDSTMKMIVDLEIKQNSAGESHLFTDIRNKDPIYADFLVTKWTKYMDGKQPFFMV